MTARSPTRYGRSAWSSASTACSSTRGCRSGRQLLEHQRPNDIEQAAIDFPELTFIIHHLGIPYVDDTINIASRHPNVWLALSAWIKHLPHSTPPGARHAWQGPDVRGRGPASLWV